MSIFYESGQNTFDLYGAFKPNKEKVESLNIELDDIKNENIKAEK